MALIHAWRDQQPHPHDTVDQARQCEAEAVALLSKNLAAEGKRLTARELGTPGPLSVAAMEAEARAAEVTAVASADAQGGLWTQPEPESRPAPEPPAGSRMAPESRQRSAGPVSRPPEPPAPPATWWGWLRQTWWAWAGLTLVGLVVLAVALVLVLYLAAPAWTWWSRALEGLS